VGNRIFDLDQFNTWLQKKEEAAAAAAAAAITATTKRNFTLPRRSIPALEVTSS
jgi:hypothetical protein